MPPLPERWLECPNCAYRRQRIRAGPPGRLNEPDDPHPGVIHTMADYRYKAFISYNHADEAWAKWFHSRLERYRIPGKLVGKTTSHGTIPKRLQPIFRDRDELSAASSLSDKVKQALADSAALVVICSPAAAASHWVSEEILEFRRSGRVDRIFAVIVDGDPAGIEGDGCFPSALLRSEDGTALEPLAADARKWADGRWLSLLKLLSGILDIPLDSLRRRDMQRRQRNWVLMTMGIVALAVIIVLAITFRMSAQKSQAEAEARRASAEQLVGFKFSEVDRLIDRLKPGEELARLDGWSEQELEQLRSESQVNDHGPLATALALRKRGIDFWRQGQASEANDLFNKSWALVADEYRKRREPELLFELGQAEFWLGQISTDAGDFKAAERSFLIYADIARQLLRAEPENADWVLELTYALSNLGALERRSLQGDPIRARMYLQAALQFNQIALVLDPNNSAYENELEQSHAFLADAHLQVCDLRGALESRLEGTRLARRAVESNPENLRAMRLLGYSLGGLSRVQLNVGLVGQAEANLRESIGLFEKLVTAASNDLKLESLLLERRSRLLAVMSLQQRPLQWLTQAAQLEQDWQAMISQAHATPEEVGLHYVEFLLVHEKILRSADRPELADQVLEKALQHFGLEDGAVPQTERQRMRLLDVVFRYYQRSGTTPSNAVAAELLQFSMSELQNPSCTQARIASQSALLLGQTEVARAHAVNLLQKGYFEPEFISFCREYELCAGE